jgi:hypothetical protein
VSAIVRTVIAGLALVLLAACGSSRPAKVTDAGSGVSVVPTADPAVAEADWHWQSVTDPETGRHFRCWLTPSSPYGASPSNARGIWCYEVVS